MGQNDVIVAFLNFLSNNALYIIIFLGIFIEIVPIKIHPISWLMKLIFKPVKEDMTKLEDRLSKDISDVKDELKQEIDQIRSEQVKGKENIDKLIESLEMTEISRMRWEIIEFANTITNNQLHTKNEYLHIKDDIRKYHQLISKYNLQNGFIDDASEVIDKHYDEHKNSMSVYF